MKVEILSYTAHDKLSRTGWAASYVFQCPCGSAHQAQSHGLWPDGNTKVSTVLKNCPINGNEVEIVLEKPEN
jgi:hypothetical protein